MTASFQGKGIGTLLLERLALLAVYKGLRRFWAVTMAENQPMLDVFRAGLKPSDGSAAGSRLLDC
jgi:GNAT superfamily N-acetyltransferase